jgi:hypothetical protein
VKLIKPNWYGLDHTAVTKCFEGDPVFVNDFCVKGEYEPCAVYHSANPNRARNHKDFMLLSKHDGKFYVRGIDAPEMEKYRYQRVAHCKACDDVVYSVMRHDFRSCSCGNIAVDGGSDYFKLSFKDKETFEVLELDFLTDTISKNSMRQDCERCGDFTVCDGSGICADCRAEEAYEQDGEEEVKEAEEDES